jgi:hypothetical protein
MNCRHTGQKAWLAGGCPDLAGVNACNRQETGQQRRVRRDEAERLDGESLSGFWSDRLRFSAV